VTEHGDGRTISDLWSWWNERQAAKPFPHLATAPTSHVRAPEADAYGPNRSAVFTPGVRTYAFLNLNDRNRFCRDKEGVRL
jgi:hypothetical protein